MTKTPEPFGQITHPQRSIRTIHRDGQTWFATADVLSILGYSMNAYGMMRGKLPADHVCKSGYLGSGLELAFTTAEGVSILCRRSAKPGAREFLDWFTQRATEVPSEAPLKNTSEATVTLTREELAKLVAMAGEAGAAAAMAVTTQTTAAQRSTPPLDAFKIIPKRPSR